MVRDAKGRFLKGTSGNPKGRSKKEVEESYLQAFRDGVTPADWKAIIERAVIDAKAGDPTARKFVADYLIGPATQRTEVTGADGGPIQTEDVSEFREHLFSRLLSEAAASGETQPAGGSD